MFGCGSSWRCWNHSHRIESRVDVERHARDFINRNERTELLEAWVIRDDEAAPCNYTQKIHLLWGDTDKIFNSEVVQNIKQGTLQISGWSQMEEWSLRSCHILLHLMHPPLTLLLQVMVSAKEEPDVPIPPAMDGLLKVHKCLVDVDTDPAHAPPGEGGTVTTRMLVAATQGGSLIGKQGAPIKTIQDASNCTIRVLGGGAYVYNVVM